MKIGETEGKTLYMVHKAFEEYRKMKKVKLDIYINLFKDLMVIGFNMFFAFQYLTVGFNWHYIAIALVFNTYVIALGVEFK